MRFFDDTTDDPCPVCLELAMAGTIQGRAVMPLPKFPARSRKDNRKCCRDCQAAETIMAMGGHPSFGPARLAVANDRIEGLTMPLGMMESFGLCQMGHLRPCSFDDFQNHHDWLESHGIPDSASVEPFLIG